MGLGGARKIWDGHIGVAYTKGLGLLDCRTR